ncbi:MAG TPA: AraC family transcriptional regulator [Myxococcota bacterium]
MIAQQTTLPLDRSSSSSSSSSIASPVSALRIDERHVDTPGLSLPSAQLHIAVRFRATLRDGFDVYAMGVRHHVRRKVVHAGQRTVLARLQLGVPAAVLGVPAAAIVESIVAVDALWSSVTNRELRERLASARTTTDAARILEQLLQSRASSTSFAAQAALVRTASRLLRTQSVAAVAAAVGVGERQLRRVFDDVVGVGPKTVARLQRFRRAVRTAREQDDRWPGWASIAVDAGYYDQAHLNAEFQQVAATTPERLRSELRSTLLLG